MGCVRVGVDGGVVVSFRYYEAPNYWDPAPGDPPGVFLAGGISDCPRWHDHAVHVLRESGVPMVVLNPNRRDFPIGNPDEGWAQVQWEQHHLHLPGVITMMWFPEPLEPGVVQPIAQFEFGQAIGGKRRLVVGAGPGYPRQRDVHWMMRYNRPDLLVHDSLCGLLDAVIVQVELSQPVGEAEPHRVVACRPPELAVMVDDVRVEVQDPHQLMPRIDLVVREKRAEQGEPVVRVLAGVPAYQPVPPALIQNSSVHQVALATVSVKRMQWVIQDCDITQIAG